MFRINFKLPSTIPSTFYYKDRSSDEAPKAKIKYYCKVLFRSLNPVYNMTFKQVIVVREKPKILSQLQQVQLTKDVALFNCCDRGYSDLTCSFEKNVFTPAEKATGEIRIDNGRC